jgi:DNA-directed RNA polymerase subunit RPC12/RpoP
MKCIRCGTDNNRKERTANRGKCKNCGHDFVFEPTSSHSHSKLTDQFFAKAIDDISVHSSLYFTPRQLQCFLNRKLSNNKISRIEYYTVMEAINYSLVLRINLLLFCIYLILHACVFLVGNALGFLSPSLILNNLIKLLLFLGSSLFFSINAVNSAQKNNTASSGIRHKKIQGDAKKTILSDSLLINGGITISFIVYRFSGFLSNIILGIISIILANFIGNLAVYIGDLIAGNHGTRERRIISNEDYYVQRYFNSWLERWQRINGQRINGNLTKMLAAPQSVSMPASVSSDVTAYSFDRLLVCDSDSIAQFLIANNFHFEMNCAILSISGYPQNIFEVTMQMVHRNPDLQVYVLHDCSPQGVCLVHQLRTSSTWFKDSNYTIIDIGITPSQVRNNRTPLIQISEASMKLAAQLSPEVQQGLNPQDLQWLKDGNFIELESLPPQKLIQIIHQSLAQSRNLNIESSSLIMVDDSTGNSYYALESFG